MYLPVEDLLKPLRLLRNVQSFQLGELQEDDDLPICRPVLSLDLIRSHEISADLKANLESLV